MGEVRLGSRTNSGRLSMEKCSSNAIVDARAPLPLSENLEAISSKCARVLATPRARLPSCMLPHLSTSCPLRCVRRRSAVHQSQGIQLLAPSWPTQDVMKA